MEGGDLFDENTAITEDIIVRPHWEGETYTVTFDGNDGTPSNPEAQVTYIENDMTKKPTMSLGSLPDASRDNYRFDGWYDGNTQFTKDTPVTKNITVKAKWTFTGYKLTFDGGGGTFDEGGATTKTITVPGTITEGPVNVKAQLPAGKPKKDNNLFDGWYTKGEEKVTTATPVSADTTYYAKWVAVPTADGWVYDSDTGGMYKTFNYLPDGSHIQSFTVLVEGSYTFELLGAAGGKGYNTTKSGGAGGKSTGTITNLPKGRPLHIYVGGKGGDTTSSSVGAGGWNGGGNGGGSGSATYKGAGGGGATDIRFGADLNTRVIVAGGGGGISGISGTGGGGGGAGADGEGGGGGADGEGGGTSGGGTSGDSGAAGYWGGGGGGGYVGFYGGGGGGGGYYGGGGGSYGGGGGGSGFVYGFSETRGNQSDSTTKIPSEYTAYQFTNGSSEQGAGSSGDGSATVTYTP
jgi:uncharacterized repeat protein (TIGR02543 family)